MPPAKSDASTASHEQMTAQTARRLIEELSQRKNFRMMVILSAPNGNGTDYDARAFVLDAAGAMELMKGQ